MEQFIDAAGEARKVCVDPVTIERVRAATEIDLYEYGMQGPDEEEVEPEKILQVRFYADPILLCRVLWELVAPEGADGADYIDFAKAFTGDAIARGHRAMEAEIVNFTSDPHQREMTRAVIETFREKYDRMMAAAKMIQAKALTNPAINRQLDSELDKLAAQCTDWPESSESAPAG